MLKSLLPKAHRKYLAMPLLGQVVDGFENWLRSNGYTSGSRKFAIRMLPHVDADLRRRRVHKVTSLTHATLHTCWRHLIRSFPTNAGTVRALERYLIATGTIAAADVEATATSAAVVLSEEYANHLREVRGFAASSISHHRYAARCFVNHLESK